MTVEGLRAEDEHGVPDDIWDGVDCALYFNGDTIPSADRIDLLQFKYSSADPDKAWTLSRLAATSAKTRTTPSCDGSGVPSQRRATSVAGPPPAFMSNSSAISRLTPRSRPYLRQLPQSEPNVTKADLRSVETATDLNGEALQQFAAALSFPETGSRFAIENDVLTNIASWTESDARTDLNNLLRFRRAHDAPGNERTMAYSGGIVCGVWVFGRWSSFPCPPQISKVAHLVSRAVSARVMDEMRQGTKYICLHGIAGCGKTTALQEIEKLLPVGSHMMVFDCYGAGRYSTRTRTATAPRMPFSNFLTNWPQSSVYHCF